jgi:hypothetical protein
MKFETLKKYGCEHYAHKCDFLIKNIVTDFFYEPSAESVGRIFRRIFCRNIKYKDYIHGIP